MKRYEGLFILNTAGKEEGIKELIDKITADIAALGGKIETIQKMDKRPFARAADKRTDSGFYVNIIFDGTPSTIVAVAAVAVRLECRTSSACCSPLAGAPSPVPGG